MSSLTSAPRRLDKLHRAKLHPSQKKPHTRYPSREDRKKLRAYFAKRMGFKSAKSMRAHRSLESQYCGVRAEAGIDEETL